MTEEELVSCEESEISSDSAEIYQEECAEKDGTAQEGGEDTPTEDDGAYYENLIREDLEELKREFSELANLEDITKIKNPMRYAALRDLGLTPTEAYLAARGNRPKQDNRSHLRGSVPGAVVAPLGSMPKGELERAREIFSGMSDSEIVALYQRVTK